jgi:hypothetical protein
MTASNASAVMPAKAGIHADSAPHEESAWTPASAGVTVGA